MMAYRSTKTYGHDVGLSAAFRQWRADGHCNLIHGYALSVSLTFEAEELDSRNWVMDFGGLKPVKEFLVNMLDHKTLIADDDPEHLWFVAMNDRRLIDLVVVPGVGCEKFAESIYNWVDQWMADNGHSPRCHLVSVEVREHGANSAIYLGESNA